MEAATVKDVTLDLVEALNAYVGDFGADGVEIDNAQASDRDTVQLTLSNGEVYTLTAEAA